MKNSTQSGLLIAIEGIDGSGKSTLARNLHTALLGQGLPCMLTKQPGGTPLGTHIRQLLQYRESPITPTAEYLLFAADRAQHMKDVVMPALNQNQLVISDRMGDSSLVYQGYGRGIDINMIQCINRWAMHDRLPDVTVYVRLDPTQARERIIARNMAQTAFEKEPDTFVEKLINGFEALYNGKDNVITIDATLPPHELTQKTITALRPWIAQKKSI